jgi:hypothetical protein
VARLGFVALLHPRSEQGHLLRRPATITWHGSVRQPHIDRGGIGFHRLVRAKVKEKCHIFDVFRPKERSNLCGKAHHRASGLNLVVAAIILWNTVYLGRAVQAPRVREEVIDEELLQHLSPLGWEHINLTGDYSWQPNSERRPGEYRPLRSVAAARVEQMA